MIRLLLAIVLCAVSLSPSAQTWPEKPLRLVVPYTAGSMGEVVARLIAEDLRGRLGQPVLVETRPGGGGNPGTLYVAQSPPDGYTLTVTATGNFVVNQFLYPNLGFDPLKALAPITIVADVPSVLFINGSIPATTFAELVQWARANKGRVNYGSPGSGSTPHLAAEAINKRFDLAMTHVPYKGAGQVVTALLANDVQFYLAGAGIGAAHVKAGKLRALAVSNDRRISALPETPTFAEAGLQDVQASNWWGLAAPAGTPAVIVDRLYAAVRETLAQPAVRERMTQLGVVGVGNSPADMSRQLAEEARYWQRTLPALGVKPD